ncbi:bifunctional UDP-N-acetylglucosamine diphosphorylase/glucosamine-1-phosphate N-acetyltransferase GlmU [Mesorhizobium sp. RP14(2022)]|uniref:Bifunctional protein GlmU n=1 Tax=Mesorhizobium liriopis TaxID=2953882 RepID=A0ABT1C853_9HYPH|nr:bifunctional UDP-N-acetylglucosamine diphosphorylase/glucosamine-1-phosphate N-acetyltransferase GlmU [Mesorhizobium liriopis]
MMTDTTLAVILAAGEGTRMKSALPKVLHPIAGLPMLGHVAKAVEAAGASDIALVVGHGVEKVRDAASKFLGTHKTFVQAERKGTAHAALAARDALSSAPSVVLVTFGDTPLITADVLGRARDAVLGGAAVAVLGFRTMNPQGYGRLIERDGDLLAIREDKDCSPDEKLIQLCNGGAMAISGRLVLELLDKIGNQNAKGEYYLTDIVELANEAGHRAAVVECAYEDVLGINNRAELAEAEQIWQQRKRRAMMLDGVTLIAPETVFFSYDTVIGQDTVVEPNVWFGPGVSVARHAVIHAFSHLEGATVDEACEVGPYARLRPGAELRRKAKVGNFCEVKKAVVEAGAKVNHLTYIGDARVGAGSNIGAGTITCNYDGYSKFFTDIGENVFIGSNSALVAPIKIGDGAYVASGSVVTDEVPADALAFGRARQVTKAGRGRELREQRAAAKAKKV